MEARHLLNKIAKRLEAAGVANARLDANLLLQMATNQSERILMHHEIALSDAQSSTLEMLVEQRLAGCPVSRLKGMREFYSLIFHINEATLDPRPDSEILVEAAITHLKEKDPKDKALIADFGTGSGCLLVSALVHLPHVNAIGLDISAEAIATARDNADRNGVSDRAVFHVSDWDEGIASDIRFDAILANPPYIPQADKETLQKEVRDYDPHLALFAGEDGLDAYRRLMGIFVRRLQDGGVAFVEIGKGQEVDVTALAIDAGLVPCGMLPDLAGIIRCLKFRK